MELAVLDQLIEALEPWVDRWDADATVDAATFAPLMTLGERLHRCNYQIWNHEDIARRDDVPDVTIRDAKRRIDELNQQRNDVVEAIDGWMLSTWFVSDENGNGNGNGRALRTETPGSAIDRLSILALKRTRMRAQTGRTEAGAEHVAACRRKLEILEHQQVDLVAALRLLLVEIAAGKVRMRVFRQFKMYNDPTLNPQLYGGAPSPSEARRR